MWFAYVDESYNDSQHWVVAVLVQHEQVNAAQRALRELARRASFAYGLAADVELHGYDIFHAEADWQTMKPLARARVGIYADVFGELVNAGCHVILRGVSRPGLERRYVYPEHPQRVTMTHLIERIDEFALDRDDYALIVADEHHETQNVLLRDLVAYQESGTWGYRGGRPLQRVVDTIHFVSSSTNRLVQGADLVAFLRLRRATHVETDARAQAASDLLWGLISPRIAHSHCWYP